MRSSSIYSSFKFSAQNCDNFEDFYKTGTLIVVALCSAIEIAGDRQ
ncbi:hypothetical protein QT995_03355 [Microcoleus sp. S36b_A3]